MAKTNRYPPEGFTERLYHVWLASGMTQKEVALQIGYERKAVRLWLYGDNIPSVLALARLCRLFEVSADYLLFGKEELAGGK